MNNKWTAKRILAIIAIVLLVGMYVASLVLAIIHSAMALTFLKITLGSTIAIPVIIYLIIMFMKLTQPKVTTEGKVYADEKDDPFTEADFEDNNEK